MKGREGKFKKVSQEIGREWCEIKSRGIDLSEEERKGLLCWGKRNKTGRNSEAEKNFAEALPPSQ